MSKNNTNEERLMRLETKLDEHIDVQNRDMTEIKTDIKEIKQTFFSLLTEQKKRMI